MEHGQAWIEELSSQCNISMAPVRLEILVQLAAGELGVSDLAAALDLALSTISHHLKPLRDAGLVDCAVSGKRHIYSLSERVQVSRSDSRLTLTLESRSGARVRIESPAMSRDATTGSQVEARPRQAEKSSESEPGAS